MTISDRTKTVIGGALGFGLMLVVIREAGTGLIFLRDLVLAWAMFAFATNRLWRRVRTLRAVGPVAGWHAGQVVMVVVMALALMALCISGLDPLLRAFQENEITAKSSLSRLAFLAMAYPVVACPVFAFWLTWTWFGARARR